jgi:tryptophan halogenase
MAQNLGNKKYRLGVVGVGTAGIVSLAHLIPWLSNNWEVVSIYDPAIPILGIGESTNPNILNTLQQGLGFVEIDDLEELEGTLKFGTRYVNWRENEWVNPLFGGGHAIHFNNFKLKEYAFNKLKELWPKKFSVLEGQVKSITNGFQCANVLVNDIVERFDYVIDCRGFPTDYSSYNISDCSPVNKCFVYSVAPHVNDQFPCTEHIATKHGWTFGIPLTTRHTYGYLFNSDITSDDDAIADINDIHSLELSKNNLVEYNFKSYYTKTLLDGRILNNGNRALFFEPLSASSIWCYVEIVELFANHLENPKKCDISVVNNSFNSMAKSLEDMLSFLYHGGSLFNTPFWDHAVSKAITRLNNSKHFSNTIAEYNRMAEQGTPLTGNSWFFTPRNLRIIDKKMNYNYFTTT